MHEVIIPLVPGFQPLDVIGPHEVFVSADQALRDRAKIRDRAYGVTLVAAEQGPVVGESGLTLTATAPLPTRRSGR